MVNKIHHRIAQAHSFLEILRQINKVVPLVETSGIENMQERKAREITGDILQHHSRLLGNDILFHLP